MVACVFLWAFCTLGVASLGSSHSYHDERDLRKTMFRGYSRSIRPVLNQTNPVDVSFTFELLNIEAMDITKQTLTMTVWTIVRWIDELMVWEKNKYGGVDKFYVHDGDKFDVWKPSILVMNTVGDFEKLNSGHLPITIHSSGEVTLESGVSLSTHCDADITYYPFDTQVCDILLGAVVYTLPEVNMTLDKIDTENYRENGEWEVISLVGSRLEMTLDTEPESFLKFTLTLKRLRPFYLMNLVIPLIMLSSLNVVVFALPVESGERMGLAITDLLSFAVFLSVIGDSLPNTSQSSPIVGVYVLITFVLSILSVNLSVLVFRLHGRQGAPVPGWLQTFVHYCLPSCMTKIKSQPSKKTAVAPINSPGQICVVDYEICENITTDEGKVDENKGDNLGTKILPFLNDGVEIDWHTVVRILDRIFFWFFLCVCSLVCLVVVLLWLLN